jgi:photosystem II stability/assembly factor-like uncharacterized protein
MKYLFLNGLFLLSLYSFAQPWTKVSALPAAHFIALENDNQMRYAATDSNIIYVSKDDGTTWAPSLLSPSTVDITALSVINHKLYVGTNRHHVFISGDSGSTWQHTGEDTSTVSSFASWNNHIYASILGNGVITLDSLFHWNSFSNGIPGYSINVFKIINVNDTLIAAAGGNGTFYRYISGMQEWQEEYYLSRLKPGLQMMNILSDGRDMIAVRISPVPFVSQNNGHAWLMATEDIIEVTPSHGKIGVGENDVYLVVNNLSTTIGGSWLQKQSKPLLATNPWEVKGDYIPTGYTYAIKEINGKVFLCRNDGVYYLDESTAIRSQSSQESFISIYPNPSDGQRVNISCNTNMNRIVVYAMEGICVFHEKARQREIQLPELLKGVYTVEIETDEVKKFYKICVQ